MCAVQEQMSQCDILLHVAVMQAGTLEFTVGAGKQVGWSTVTTAVKDFPPPPPTPEGVESLSGKHDERRELMSKTHTMGQVF